MISTVPCQDPTELVAFERPLDDGRRLVVRASAGLEPQAMGLLGKLAALDREESRLSDGRIVWFGWSRLTLRRPGDAPVLTVHEPDFSGDPERATVPHAEWTLRVLRDQAAVLEIAGVSPEEVRFNQIIVCETGCLRADECYFERRAPVGGHDSGWYAGCAGPESQARRVTESDLEAMPVARLVSEFPAVLALLALPVGFLGVFRWEQLVALFRPGGESVSLRLRDPRGEP